MEFYSSFDLSKDSDKDSFKMLLVIIHLVKTDKYFHEIIRSGRIVATEDEIQSVFFMIESNYDIENPKLINKHYHFGLNERTKEIIEKLRYAKKVQSK